MHTVFNDDHTRIGTTCVPDMPDLYYLTDRGPLGERLQLSIVQLLLLRRGRKGRESAPYISCTQAGRQTDRHTYRQTHTQYHVQYT